MTTAPCKGCGKSLAEWTVNISNERKCYCKECYQTRYIICPSCLNETKIEDTVGITDKWGFQTRYCEECSVGHLTAS